MNDLCIALLQLCIVAWWLHEQRNNSDEIVSEASVQLALYDAVAFIKHINIAYDIAKVRLIDC